MTRHCFGSYFDILKEMTYSPKMGEQFSYAHSACARQAWDTQGDLVFPDENMGREIMQLFVSQQWLVAFNVSRLLAKLICLYLFHRLLACTS